MEDTSNLKTNATPAEPIQLQSAGTDHWAIVIGVLIFAVLVICAYLLRFSGATFSRDPEQWGQLGDYIGGVLNPAVAMAALVLLAISVQLQRRELRAAHEALKSQAESSAQTVRLNAITLVVPWLDQQIAEKQRFLERLEKVPSQTKLDLPEMYFDKINQANEELEELRARKTRYLAESERLLDNVLQ